jgi:hypothetical protein
MTLPEIKISMGMKLQQGPWGGGNQFGRALSDFLQKKNARVSYDLQLEDLDIILLTDPRPHLKSSAFTDTDIAKYLFFKNPRAIVVHRVNECDERKGTKGLNKRLQTANLCADYTIFVSGWLKSLHMSQGFPCRESRVIHNGSDESVFHNAGYSRWNRREPLKLVTHHWGAHAMKGFDLYSRLDNLMLSSEFKNKLSFAYIGNLPQGFGFKNASYHEPVHGAQLAGLLREHHVYVTASINEPGSHHQNEGALCGLPLLYRESGALPEYCRGFGVAFTENNFEEKIREMMAAYETWANAVQQYPHTAAAMCSAYYSLLCEINGRREELVQQRSWRRWPLWLARILTA